MNEKKIYIEASHLIYGGGYILLIEFIEGCSVKGISTHVYLMNSSLIGDLSSRNIPYLTVKKTTRWQTLIRYFGKRSNTLFFVNLPPFRRSYKSVIYYHNDLILNNTLQGLMGLKYRLYTLWLLYFSVNVDYVCCQTKHIEASLNNVGINNTLRLPFFRAVKGKRLNAVFDFCYVSSTAEHKNLIRLITAIDKLRESRDFKFVLTVERNSANGKILRAIKKVNDKFQDQVIFNAGLISKDDVIGLYSTSKCLVFPSLKESLGLPLIEACTMGLTVLSSDLDYSYNVIEGAICFNPLNVDEIALRMSQYLDGHFDNVNQKVKVQNEIDNLISLMI